MKKGIKRVISLLAGMLLAFSLTAAVGAESCGLESRTGYCFTAKASNKADGEEVYNRIVKKQTNPETAQRLYNLMFKAKYRPLDFGGSYWCKGNGGNGITSAYDSGLGQTVNWGWTSWGCCSYGYFGSKYTRNSIGTRNGTGFKFKPAPATIKGFITNYADPGEHIRFYYQYNGRNSVHSVVYLGQDNDGIYFLSENGGNLDIRLYYCTYQHLYNIIRVVPDDYSINIFDTNAGKDKFAYIPTVSLSADTDTALVGSQINLSMNGENNGNYELNIYRDSTLVTTTTVNGGKYTFNCNQKGQYYATATAFDTHKTYNTVSKRVSWQVFDVDTSKIKRLAGTSRIHTSLEISKEGWSGEGADTVILTNAYSFADALSGGPLSNALDAPILLTANGSIIEQSVVSQIQALGAKNIVILGGEAAVNKAIEAQLTAAGFNVDRISGQTRLDTAVAIAEELFTISGAAPQEVFISYAYNYPDALAAGSVAAINGTPILFANKDGSINEATAHYLTSYGIDKAVILGGVSAVAGNAEANLAAMGISDVSRLSGKSRYDTALEIVSAYDEVFQSDDVILATGTAFPDALSGGALGAKVSAPVLLVNSSAVSDEMIDYLAQTNPQTIFVLGGEGVVSDKTVYMHMNH